MNYNLRLINSLKLVYSNWTNPTKHSYHKSASKEKESTEV